MFSSIQIWTVVFSEGGSGEQSFFPDADCSEQLSEMVYSNPMDEQDNFLKESAYIKSMFINSRNNI